MIDTIIQSDHVPALAHVSISTDDIATPISRTSLIRSRSGLLQYMKAESSCARINHTRNYAPLAEGGGELCSFMLLSMRGTNPAPEKRASGAKRSRMARIAAKLPMNVPTRMSCQ